MPTARQTIGAYSCPSCGTDRVRRAHRQGLLERTLSIVNIYPYYCLSCPSETRFHRFRKK